MPSAAAAGFVGFLRKSFGQGGILTNSVESLVRMGGLQPGNALNFEWTGPTSGFTLATCKSFASRKSGHREAPP